MTEKSDGFTTRKIKIGSVLRYSSLQPIFEKYVNSTSKIAYKMGIMFWYYISYCILEKIDFKITTTTLGRCANLVMDGSGADKSPNDESRILKIVFEKHRDVLDKIPIKYYKSAARPFVFFNATYLANIENHITINMQKFQKRYVNAVVEMYLERKFTCYPNDTLSKPLSGKRRAIMAYLVQQTLNKSSKPIKLKESNKNMPPALLEALMPHIRSIIKKLVRWVPEKLVDKMTDGNLKSNLSSSIRYFSHMSRFLASRGKKSFSPIPHISLHRHHITFDKNFMFNVYNDWMKSMIEPNFDGQGPSKQNLKKKSPKIDPYQRVEYKPVIGPDFIKNWETFYAEMFKFDDIYNSEKQSAPATIVTDAVSVSVLLKSIENAGKSWIQKKQETSAEKRVKIQAEIKARIAPPAKFPKKEPYSLDSNPCVKGGFEADSLRASKETLEGYDIIGIDPGNKNMICWTREDGNPIESSNYLSLSCSTCHAF